MPVQENGETYYTAAEAAAYLNISRDTFYRSIRSQLQPYQFGLFKRTYYRQSELDALRRAHPIEPENKGKQ